MEIQHGLTLRTPRVILATAKQELYEKCESAIKATGWVLATASTAEAVLTLIAAPNAPGILLLDTELPGMSTLQLLAATRGEVARNFPIVVVAETLSHELNERLVQGDIDDLIPASADAFYWQMRIESALRAKKMAREVEQLREASLLHSQFDSLTGAYNREALLTMLFRETDRVQRSKGTLCMILFDIDDFGHWNALFGTAACDDLLCQVVMRTRRLLRSYDLFGRAGKDEFVVALPGCGGVNAVMLAERLRQEVFSQPYATGDQNIRLSACFGLSISRGRSPVVVLREAELALEQARKTGPESIQFFNDEGLSLSALELPPSRSDEFAW
jgi:diguanylate cyclase (GGDEF)-like protein